MAWTEPRGKFSKDARGVIKARQWRGCCRDIEGKTKGTATVDSEREAMGLAQDAEAKMRAGTWHDPSAGQLLFSTYFEEQWLPNRLREKTPPAPTDATTTPNGSMANRIAGEPFRSPSVGLAGRSQGDRIESAAFP